MQTTLTNEQIFKLICMEVIETAGLNSFPPVITLREMIEPGFAEFCENMVFFKDDQKIDPGEQLLIDWMRENRGNWELVRELMPVAKRLDSQLR